MAALLAFVPRGRRLLGAMKAHKQIGRFSGLATLASLE